MQKTCDKQDRFATVAAWNRISKEICSLLCEDDIKEMKENTHQCKTILQKKTAPYLSPEALEYFGLFLQGGLFVDDLLIDFFDLPVVANAIGSYSLPPTLQERTIPTAPLQVEQPKQTDGSTVHHDWS